MHRAKAHRSDDVNPHGRLNRRIARATGASPMIAGKSKEQFRNIASEQAEQYRLIDGSVALWV